MVFIGSNIIVLAFLNCSIVYVETITCVPLSSAFQRNYPHPQIDPFTPNVSRYDRRKKNPALRENKLYKSAGERTNHYTTAGPT